MTAKVFKGTVRFLIGFSLALTSVILTDLGIYYAYIRPEKKRLQGLIEKELIKADRAGFHLPK